MINLTWIVYGKLLNEQHSIMVLSSILKKNDIKSNLIYTNSSRTIIDEIKKLKPDIVAYSLMYGDHRKYIPVSKEIRKSFPEIYQIAGGPYTTYYPESIDEMNLDAICIGEGDITLLDFVNTRFNSSLKSNYIEGFHIKDNGNIIKNQLSRLLDDLDSLPFPDRELFYSQDKMLKNHEFKSFFSGRGCPYLCSYCFNHKFNEMYKGKGNIIRKKSVNYFIEEIKETKAKYGCQYIIFEDDIFTLKKDWFYEFSKKFKDKIALPYICHIRPNLIDDDIVKLLKESGCHIVRMAIETGNENLRTKILNRNIKNETIIKASDLIHSAGLKLSALDMIGLPTETLENLKETIDLNIRCKPEHPSAQFFMPYPGMELTKIAINTGYFDNELLSKLEKNIWKNTPLKFDKNTKLKMEKIQKLFSLIVKYPFLKNYYSIIFKIPLFLLYYISLLTKIFIVIGYIPRVKISLSQRIRVLIRFFGFYN